jgi:hypothetical protein
MIKTDIIRKMMKPANSKIAFRTCFSSRSFNGYKLDILKSAVQKYLRRREFHKMVWCVGEIYLFQVYAKSDTEKRATKGIISNLINRLIIMLDEEMLFAECEKYLLVRKYMEDFEKSDRGNFECLFKICDVMCGARMIRRNSDIRGYWSPRNKALKIDDGDSTDEYYFEKFKEKFEENDSECFIWMFKIFYRGAEGEVVRYRRKENIYMIWEYLFGRENIKENEVLRCCLEYRLKEFYKKNRTERFIFLTAAIDIAMYKGKNVKKDWFDCSKKVKFDINSLVKEEDEKFADVNIIESVYEKWGKMEIDDYAIDMHTSAGRRMGKNKVDFIASGAVIVDEDKEYFVKEWRDCYNNAKKASFAAAVALRKKKEEKKTKKNVKVKVVVEENKEAKKEEKKSKKTEREKIRAAKYKLIKKMRGKPDFNELEKNLKFVDGLNIQKEKLILCSDQTCGNKVMCFEYKGKIWKESRKSMFYNRDYCVLDACKEYFGLRKIGMERILSNFRIEKIDKNKKSWKDNWHKVIIREDEEKVVYCVMNKITHCNWKVPMEISVIKHSFQNGECRRHLKEFAKIGVFRGIFRCSDFNCRNVLVGCDKSYLADYFVSIDEGDIGKRLDIIGKRETWLIKALNKDKTIINEILNELTYDHTKIIMSLEQMERYKFKRILIDEVENNWKNLRKDLEKEGILFD